MKNLQKVLFACAILLVAYSCKKAITTSDTGQADSVQLKTENITGQSLGVNYNANMSQLDFTELAKTKTTWVRGFLPFFRYYNAYLAKPGGTPADWFNDPNMAAYITIKPHGYKAIGSIKFDFTGTPFPAMGSTEFNNQMNFLDKLLAYIATKSDVIVVGNEPFIESDTTGNQRNGPLNNYYQTATARTNTYLVNNVPAGSRPLIYVGAFDNLYLATKQALPGVISLLTFAKNQTYVAGVDVHIHHTGTLTVPQNIYPDIKDVFDFVVPKIGTTQKIIVTEFSLAKHWDQHRDDALTSSFLTYLQDNPTTPAIPASVNTVIKYINYALQVNQQRPLAEWTAWNLRTPFLADHKDYLCRAFTQFTSRPKFAVACYSERQFDAYGSTIDPDQKPWVLNGLFVSATVKLEPDGDAQKRWGFFEDFLAINDNDPNTDPCSN